MYNFVFAWVPAMDELASKVRHAAAENLPLGIIFASFMCSMMLGSLLYGYVVRRAAGTAQYLPVPTTSDDQVNSYRPLALHGRMATVLLAGAGMALGVANASPFLQAQFWGFCLFEFTVGLYFPVMGWLKSELVHDDVRATVRLFLSADLRTTRSELMCSYSSLHSFVCHLTSWSRALYY